ncbi:FAD-dependent oxidoreductase [Mycolicibacterium fluoranthenivorans]|uniref:ferredoxin--NADP(+) reductase n=1 Tax=Mycolicibacterium fluoranthenivorans TaxID=258505 RepID=A0A7G8PLW9_9MYCO|nr:FAD-dependent oxidoreductase [Mycolicibacterium fluoranthenivorans]QNJ95335.1 FAD-dependent oxidoreductase [Mycolicibacterium fluoranthenivorans]
MSYVITQNCCKDASCIPVCPVDCIRPVEGDDTDMLYIDPDSCIDCGACFDECPVDAIHYEDDLPPGQERFREINAAYFERYPLQPDTAPLRPSRPAVPSGALRVAIVGAGPAACYAAAELIAIDGVEVNLFERLPTPFGLIRAGVAPDHQHTKSVVNIFERVFTNRRFGCHLGVEIGRDLTHEDLLAHHHAVIYAVGAATSRALGIPGEDLPGSHPAADFVGWYNGHPDHAGRAFDLDTERAVIVGNGNVALDVARVLLMDRDALAATDIAEHALEALRTSAIREVVILGRRGIADAAFSVGEFLALGHLDGVDIVIDGDLSDPADGERSDGARFGAALKVDIAREYAGRAQTPGNKRIVFRFNATPQEIIGSGVAQELRVARGGTTETLATGLILRSIGYRGLAVDGLPFDEAAGVVPNEDGRVSGVRGSYVTGWIKRGPRGVIGTNRTCAVQTVDALWQDHLDGALQRDVAEPVTLRKLLEERGIRPLDWSGWRAIDGAERDRGAVASRPRVKFIAIEDLHAAALADS